MQLYQLKPIHKLKKSKRVGRGGKKGTYSGRGMKGQKSRAGTSYRVDFAGGDTPLTKRLPNKRGFVGHLKIKHGVKPGRSKSKPIVFNLKDLNNKFKEGETVSLESLEEKGMIRKINKTNYPNVKILGLGQIDKNLKIKDLKISKSVQKKLNFSK